MKNQEGHSGNIDFNFSLGDLLGGIGKLVDLVQRLEREGRSELSQVREIKGLGEKGLRGVFGISLKTGINGIAHLDSFGNIRQSKDGLIFDEIQEPNVDLFDEGDYLQIIGEVPGVRKSDIQVKVNGTLLDISASGFRRKYRKEISLPFPASPENISISFNNGILEIKISKNSSI